MIRFAFAIGCCFPALLAASAALSASAAIAPPPPPQPYFVSIKVDKAYMREGPSEANRIKWVYQRKGLPLEVLASFEVWRRVRDMEGEVGWIHTALLSRERTVAVTGDSDVSVHRREAADSEILAQAKPGAIGRLIGCGKLACEVKFGAADGWVERARLWGVHDGPDY
jgi:SH3-like domain-containing protein